MSILKIGTRDSILALWQAEKVQALLYKNKIPSTLVPIKTQGDLILDKSLPSIGGKGLFTAELDEMMLQGKIDLAVHSLKDLPVEENIEIKVSAVLQRDDARDCFVIPNHKKSLSYNSIATSSTRRKAFLLHQFPNIKVENIRGNVQTRIRKLNSSDWDAAVFAAAGLQRLNMQGQIFSYADFMIPAPAQGIIAITALQHNEKLQNQLQDINHIDTANCAEIERAFLHGLGGGCSSPVGAFCVFENNMYSLKTAVLTIDGSKKIDIIMQHSNKTECYKQALHQAEKLGVSDIISYNEKMGEKL